MRQVTPDEIIGNFTAAYEDQLKVKDLKSQASEISKDITARLKGFAQDLEADFSQVKQAYKRFCDLKNGGDAESEDFYLMVSAIDAYFSEDEGDMD